MKRLTGVVAPLVTPFDSQGRIDTESLKRLTNYVIDGGIQALYPCGTNGEMMMLSIEERKLVAETVIEECANRIPVFVQAGAQTLEGTLELEEHAVVHGADGIGVVTPPFFKLSDEELFQYYQTISKSAPEDFPIYLYGIPQNAVNDISFSLANRLAEECRNIVGIKYSFPDVCKIEQFLTICNGEFSVLVGPDELFQAVVQIGGDGVVSGNAQIFCREFEDIWEALVRGDTKKATDSQKYANDIIALMRENNGIASCKYLLYRKEIIATPDLRAPQSALTQGQASLLVERLRNLKNRKVKT